MGLATGKVWQCDEKSCKKATVISPTDNPPYPIGWIQCEEFINHNQTRVLAFCSWDCICRFHIEK